MKKEILFIFFLLSFSKISFSQLNKEYSFFFPSSYEDMINYEIMHMVDTTNEKGKKEYKVLSKLKKDFLIKLYEHLDTRLVIDTNSLYYYHTLVRAALIAEEINKKNNAIINYKKALHQLNSNESNLLKLIELEELGFQKIIIKKNIAKILINKEQFTEAIQYLKTIKRDFISNIILAPYYMSAYEGLKDYDSSVKYSLICIFHDYLLEDTGEGSTTIPDPSKLINEIVLLLKEKYSSELLISNLEKALKNYYLKQSQNSQKQVYFIKYLDVEIELPFYEISESQNLDNYFLEEIKKLTFYKLISK